MTTVKDVFNATESDLDSYLLNDPNVRLLVKQIGVIIIANNRNLLNNNDSEILNKIFEIDELTSIKDTFLNNNIVLSRIRGGNKETLFNNLHQQRTIEFIPTKRFTDDENFQLMNRSKNTIVINGNQFWYGTYGCLVPIYISKCLTADGINIFDRNYGITQNYVPNPPSKNEWLARFTYEMNGYRYYNKNLE
jgi:hypothetical protein